MFKLCVLRAALTWQNGHEPNCIMASLFLRWLFAFVVPECAERMACLYSNFQFRNFFIVLIGHVGVTMKYKFHEIRTISA